MERRSGRRWCGPKMLHNYLPTSGRLVFVGCGVRFRYVGTGESELGFRPGGYVVRLCLMNARGKKMLQDTRVSFKHQTRPRLHLALTGITLLVCHLSLRVATGTPIRRLCAVAGTDKDEQATLLFASNNLRGFAVELQKYVHLVGNVGTHHVTLLYA